jgi:hypothetical protein
LEQRKSYGIIGAKKKLAAKSNKKTAPSNKSRFKPRFKSRLISHHVSHRISRHISHLSCQCQMAVKITDQGTLSGDEKFRFGTA